MSSSSIVFLRVQAIAFALQMVLTAKVSENSLFIYGNSVKNKNFLSENFRVTAVNWIKLLGKLLGLKLSATFTPPCYLDSDWLLHIKRVIKPQN